MKFSSLFISLLLVNSLAYGEDKTGMGRSAQHDILTCERALSLSGQQINVFVQNSFFIVPRILVVSGPADRTANYDLAKRLEEIFNSIDLPASFLGTELNDFMIQGSDRGNYRDDSEFVIFHDFANDYQTQFNIQRNRNGIVWAVDRFMKKLSTILVLSASSTANEQRFLQELSQALRARFQNPDQDRRYRPPNHIRMGPRPVERSSTKYF